MMKSKTYAYRQIFQPVLTFILCAGSITAHAVIISDDSERRIQIRQNSSTNTSNSDSMQNLIVQKQRDFEIDARLSIEENKRVNIVKRGATYSTSNNTYNGAYKDSTNMDFNAWLNSNSYRARQVAAYERYLSSRVGSQNVPPLSQLLTTARSWSKCGYEPYQLPPQELWPNIVPTLHLYSELKNQGILPPSSEIRSVYRNPGLNDCAGGADSSKHMNASAIDIWVPEYEDNLWRLNTLQDGLCQFWQYQGQSYNFGLGLYATGAIHLDTDGYRKWGFNHASSSSSCRY
ncbi:MULTISPECIES: D-Ala-D-Ala carboxypeptidase family metallohydrolase [unclassified Psychrobacter]|uniref:D-Ala-D-Ala carboxypeptidase family metallohydrolase n=1 Tax=unclassified Psychrobacter TaxID=196806 RepID=UPI003FBA344D